MNTEELDPEVANPEVRIARRWNVVWVVPLVALVVGGWLLYKNFASSGPHAEVRFDTAEGIDAGTTAVRCRSVKVGVVKSVTLDKDIESVVVDIEFEHDSERFLREGTRFWVVRPRFSLTGFSGADTLIKGSYIELDPGALDGPRKSVFRGLETPPTTNSNVPGLRLNLAAETAGSLMVGSPIYFRGVQVGRIEERNLDGEGRGVTYNAFIDENFSHLLRKNSRFWVSSGIDISADVNGFKVRTPSLQSLIAGGVSFGLMDGHEAGAPAEDGQTFTLHRDMEAASLADFNPTLTFLLLFEQSVRGLTENAPVEFRGLKIGRVREISFDLINELDEKRIPVLIEIDPSLMGAHAGREVVKEDSRFFEQQVNRGLRASLKSASLITGALYVDLDLYPDAFPESMGEVAGQLTLPTVSAGFAQLEAKLTAILDKLEGMPVNETLDGITKAADEARLVLTESKSVLGELEASAAAARTALENPELTELPGELRTTLEELQKSVASVGPEGPVQGDLLRTLDELRASLRAMKSLTTTIDEKPNSLLFGRKSSGNPVPRAAEKR
ncbi:MAG: intermembrane transport protein PqiB [Verrucomicrobiales bacterium]|nr:intermembrane transport protein PqiB [Verrucomicrobiota bacterium JB025]